MHLLISFLLRQITQKQSHRVLDWVLEDPLTLFVVSAYEAESSMICYATSF